MIGIRTNLGLLGKLFVPKLVWIFLYNIYIIKNFYVHKITKFVPLGNICILRSRSFLKIGPFEVKIKSQFGNP